MKDYKSNGQSHKQGKCNGRKRSRLFRRRCDKLLFTTSGSNNGGLNKILSKQLVKMQFSMEFQHIHKSNHIIASAWLRILQWLGYLFAIARYKTSMGTQV